MVLDKWIIQSIHVEPFPFIGTLLCFPRLDGLLGELSEKEARWFAWLALKKLSYYLDLVLWNHLFANYVTRRWKL